MHSDRKLQMFDRKISCDRKFIFCFLVSPRLGDF